MQVKQPIILFDGFCNLCNGTVDFIIKRDRKKQFRFVPLQSETGKSLTQIYQNPPYTDSVILIKKNTIHIESDAAIEIAGMLSYPWKLMVLLRIIPKKIRDKLYGWIAKNRYNWFGKQETCRISISEEKEYFKP